LKGGVARQLLRFSAGARTSAAAAEQAAGSIISLHESRVV